MTTLCFLVDRKLHSTLTVPLPPNHNFITLQKVAYDLAQIGILKGHKRGVWTVRFSPVERVIATGSGDRTVKLWSLDDWGCLKVGPMAIIRSIILALTLQTIVLDIRRSYELNFACELPFAWYTDFVSRIGWVGQAMVGQD